jgi:hypothetical protein
MDVRFENFSSPGIEESNFWHIKRRKCVQLSEKHKRGMFVNLPQPIIKTWVENITTRREEHEPEKRNRLILDHFLMIGMRMYLTATSK